MLRQVVRSIGLLPAISIVMAVIASPARATFDGLTTYTGWKAAG
jgi:hypothetical protein